MEKKENAKHQIDLDNIMPLLDTLTSSSSATLRQMIRKKSRPNKTEKKKTEGSHIHKKEFCAKIPRRVASFKNPDYYSFLVIY